jgi:5-methylcytosine-specific restriction endonuclease McrA
MPQVGSKEKLRQFLRANIGRVIESRELQAAADGAVQYDRRVRELREDERWPILTHNDSTDLKPGQYLLREQPPDKSAIRFTKGISSKLRAQVYDRNGFTCQMCGLTPGEIDPVTQRKVRLHVGHIKDKSLGGKDELSNLRTLCSSCNQGAKNVTAEKPTTIWLLAQVRRAGHEEQEAVLQALCKKFHVHTVPD